MKHTQVIKYLIETLQESSLIRYNQDFLNLINDHMDNTPSKKQLSGYTTRIGSIQNKPFLLAIEKKFGFTKHIWDRNDAYQINCIQKSIENLLEVQKLPNKSALDISHIMYKENSITQKQIDLIDKFKKNRTQKKLEKDIDVFLTKGLMEKKIENQEFLIRLLHIAYDKGLYSIIMEFILPNLYGVNRQQANVQKIEAHTLGSLEEYDEAKHILHLLIHHNTIENINLRTSALSNHKRELFFSKEPIKNDELYLLIQGYQELHAVNGIYSYYTGINLLYMVILGQLIFPSDTRYFDMNTEEIYTLSKPSLKEDKTHDTYYVVMSDFEFQLLLCREGIFEKLENFLEDTLPHTSLIERTCRQMKLFVAKSIHVKKSVKNLKKAIIILESYCQFSNELNK